MTVKVRSPAFVFSSTIASHWCGDLPEFSHVASAFMAALPELEPYFIHNVREGLQHVTDPTLREQVEWFVAQEARHAQQHRRFNQLLSQRYPELPRLERQIRARLDHSKRHHSLAFRLAYTAGYEAITYHLVCLMMAQRKVWLQQADQNVLALLAWHAAEEVEHKSVAYDLFRAVHGGYLMRTRGLASAFVHTIREIRLVTRYFLEVDGLYRQRACRRRLRALRISLLTGLVPRFLAYLRPSYEPADEQDPPLLLEWLERHDRGAPFAQLAPDELEALANARLATAK